MSQDLSARVAADRARWQQELERDRIEAVPIRVVNLDVPTGTIVRIALVFVAVQFVVGLIGLALLFLVGVL